MNKSFKAPMSSLYRTLITRYRERVQNISDFDIALFFRQLSTLLCAGIPIVQCCELLQVSQEKIAVSLLIRNLKKEIESGKYFFHALKKFPHCFNSFTCHLVHAGEQSGTLENILKRIAHDKEQSLKLKNQIKKALFYPSFIFCIALCITLFMIIIIIPRFAELFESMHSKLPIFTQGIIFISECIKDNLIYLSLLISFTAFFCFSFKTKLKYYFDPLLLKIPFIKNILQKIILIRMTRALAITFGAGIPITDCLKMIEKLSRNLEYMKALKKIQMQISSGKQLYAALQTFALFPPMMVQMIKIGEDAGKLEFMLEKIADIYESDIEQLVNYLSDLLEPLIMVILGVLIGGLVIAMYLPIFKLGTII